jgi:F0F1-type ATP synthase gamma subunit
MATALPIDAFWNPLPTFHQCTATNCNSLAAEHGGRLAAMQAAEKNIDERLEEVTGRFRRVRQEQITSELLDVVSGFEALS